MRVKVGLEIDDRLYALAVTDAIRAGTSVGQILSDLAWAGLEAQGRTNGIRQGESIPDRVITDAMILSLLDEE